jgi:hypothetical protein
MKKFCLRANYLALFKRTPISISTKKELQINESKIACCPITLFACLVELWKGENLNKVTLGNSYWTRESQYDIGVGSTNETKKFSSSPWYLTTSTSPAYNTATSYGYAESHSTLTILTIRKGNQVSKESFQTYSPFMQL